jgi:O-antigen biosynthesis protein
MNLARQLRNYSSGHVAYHAALLTRFGDARGLWHLGLDVNRHLVRRTRDRLLGRISTPWSLVWAEVRGFVAGPLNVVRTIMHARRHGFARPLAPQDPWDAQFDVSRTNGGAHHG